jgi:nucleosome binding factor SPN SPT16 subunit
MCSKWLARLQQIDGFEMNDIAAAFSEMLYVKEEDELKTVRKAALVSTKALQHSFVKKFEEAVDAEAKIKHSKLATEVEDDIFEPTKIKIKTLKKDQIDISYQPIIQSGGKYDFKLSAESNDDLLHDHVVTCSIGARYRSYCSNIARTFFIDPDKAMQKNYDILLGAQQACFEACTPGREFADVYKAAEAHIAKSENPDLKQNLEKNVGWGVGLEHRESGTLLNLKNTRKIAAGMVFNICLGLNNLERANETDEKRKTYAITIADTVAVNATGEPELFTVDAKSGWADVSYEFGDNDEPAEPEKKPVKAEKESVITTRVRQTKEDFQLDDDARKRHQADLERKLQEDASKRYAAGNVTKKEETKGKSIVAYKSSTDYPDLAVRKNCVQVDTRNECVLIPINGVVVPFHISLVKNVTKSGGEDGQLTFLRLIFNTPGSVNMKETIAKTVHTNANYSFISEVSFKSRNKQNIEQNLRVIKELQKRIKDREKKKEEESQAYKQEALIISRRGTVPRLPELQMRPVASGRKSAGTLECHDNGFRFSTHKGEKVDIMYNNIKHALHEPADNELIVLIHFHLKQAIMVGKKRHLDIQFYTELGEANESLDFGRRSMWDPDEIESEQREKKTQARYESKI